MSESTAARSVNTPSIKLRNIALPVEHGGWSFMAEPLVLGLLLAPTVTGLFLALAVVGVFLVIRGKGRSALAEISGAVALGASAAAIVIAGGWTPVAALALWVVPAVRAFSSILYIRIRLRRARGETANRLPATLSSLVN